MDGSRLALQRPGGWARQGVRSVSKSSLGRDGRWRNGMSWRRRTGVDGVGRRPWLWGPGLGRVPIKRRAGCSGPCARLMHTHPSPSEIQTHLYNSFLHASTYDVAIRVSGSWNAVYKLHRVVLIQSVSIMLSVPPAPLIRITGILSIPLHCWLFRVRHQACRPAQRHR